LSCTPAKALGNNVLELRIWLKINRHPAHLVTQLHTPSVLIVPLIEATDYDPPPRSTSTRLLLRIEWRCPPDDIHTSPLSAIETDPVLARACSLVFQEHLLSLAQDAPLAGWLAGWPAGCWLVALGWLAGSSLAGCWLAGSGWLAACRQGQPGVRYCSSF
jgi:hypothetical protein